MKMKPLVLVAMVACLATMGDGTVQAQSTACQRADIKCKSLYDQIGVLSKEAVAAIFRAMAQCNQFDGQPEIQKDCFNRMGVFASRSKLLAVTGGYRSCICAMGCMRKPEWCH